MLLRTDKQQIVAHGYPDLRVDRVHCCSIEGFDVKLLDPLEEKLYLSTFSVQFCDGKWVFNGEVVSREVMIELPGFIVLIHNESDRVGVHSSRVVPRESDGLVGENARTFAKRSGLNDLVSHIVFGSGNKVSTFLTEVLVELLKGRISIVHQVESICFGRDVVDYLSIVDLAWCKQNRGRNRTSQVHQSVILEGPFAMTKLRPGAQLQTRSDGTAVKRMYHLFKTNSQLFILVKRRCLLHQRHRKVLLDMPILLLVGLRKRRFGHHLDARSVEVSSEVKCSLNISQTRSISGLSEVHHNERVTAIELDGMPVASVSADTLLEFIFVSERHNLCKDRFSFVHGLRMAS